MTLVTLVSVAVVVFVLLRSHPTRRRTTAAVGAAVGLANPWPVPVLPWRGSSRRYQRVVHVMVSGLVPHSSAMRPIPKLRAWAKIAV